MRVLFIFSREFADTPNKPLSGIQVIHIGVSLLSAVLKQHGHQTRLLVLTHDTSINLIGKTVMEFEPEMVCFTSVSSEFDYIVTVAEYFKKCYPLIFRVVGGTHVTLAPDDSMLDVFDALCIGEGEATLIELVNTRVLGERIDGIQNLWLKNEAGEVRRNSSREFIQDLDSLPFPDLEIWNEWIDANEEALVPPILLGRGCPYLCAYCSNHVLRNIAPGKYVRFRSPENIVAEIRSVKRRYPRIANIYMEVETFIANMEWAMELCHQMEELRGEFGMGGLGFMVNIRVNPSFPKHADDFFARMKKAGFRSVNIGLESGSPRIREAVLRRHYGNDDIIQSVDLARKHGIEVRFFLLIGLPGETPDDYFMTVEVTRRCLPEKFYLSIFHPYPGTDLQRLCQENGYMPKTAECGLERRRARLEYPDFPMQLIQKAFIWFHFYVLRELRTPALLARIIVDRYFRVYRAPLDMCLIPLYMVRDLYSNSLTLDSGNPERTLAWLLAKEYVMEAVRRARGVFPKPDHG